jgi:hypothetical protein
MGLSPVARMVDVRAARPIGNEMFIPLVVKIGCRGTRVDCLGRLGTD